MEPHLNFEVLTFCLRNDVGSSVTCLSFSGLLYVQVMGRWVLERLWVRPWEVPLAAVGLSAICLPHASSFQVRSKQSACCRGATFPLLSSPSPSHFPQRAYEVGVTLVAQINLKLKPGPKGSGPVILPCVPVCWLCSTASLCCLVKSA